MKIHFLAAAAVAATASGTASVHSHSHKHSRSSPKSKATSPLHADTDQLSVSAVCLFDESYADHGTSSREDLSVYQVDDHCPASTGDWFEVGHFGVSGYHTPTSCGLVVTSDNEATVLAKPVGMTMNWFVCAL